MSINTVNFHVGANYEGIKSLVKHNKIHSFLEGSYVCLLNFPFSVLRMWTFVCAVDKWGLIF